MLRFLRQPKPSCQVSAYWTYAVYKKAALGITGALNLVVLFCQWPAWFILWDGWERKGWRKGKQKSVLLSSPTLLLMILCKQVEAAMREHKTALLGAQYCLFKGLAHGIKKKANFPCTHFRNNTPLSVMTWTLPGISSMSCPALGCFPSSFPLYIVLCFCKLHGCKNATLNGNSQT